eukprot:SAG22_NODE_833_length_6929_cov_27.036159_4_plen_277_part_00
MQTVQGTGAGGASACGIAAPDSKVANKISLVIAFSLLLAACVVGISINAIVPEYLEYKHLNIPALVSAGLVLLFPVCGYNGSKDRNRSALCCMNCCSFLVAVLTALGAAGLFATSYISMVEGKAIQPCCATLSNCSWAVSGCSCNATLGGHNISTLPSNNTRCGPGFTRHRHGPGFRRLSEGDEPAFNGVCLDPDSCKYYDRVSEMRVGELYLHVAIMLIPLLPALCTCTAGLVLWRDPHVRFYDPTVPEYYEQPPALPVATVVSSTGPHPQPSYT